MVCGDGGGGGGVTGSGSNIPGLFISSHFNGMLNVVGRSIISAITGRNKWFSSFFLFLSFSFFFFRLSDYFNIPIYTQANKKCLKTLGEKKINNSIIPRK